MACLGSTQSWYTGRFPWYQSTNQWITGEKRLTQRAKWLYKCGDIGQFRIIAAHVWNRRRSYYFAETTSLLVEAIIDNILVKTPNYAMPHRCYYLGSYPIYWDGKREVVTYAHVVQDGPRWPLTKRPSHPFIPGWYPTREQINEYGVKEDNGQVLMVPFDTDLRLADKLEEWTANYKEKYGVNPRTAQIKWEGYRLGIKWANVPPGITFGMQLGFPDPMWTSLDKQQRTIDGMEQVIKDCIKKNYLDGTFVPQKKVQTPFGPVEWPGKPIDELNKPTPEKAPGSPAPDLLKLTVTFGFTEPPSADGLALNLELIKGPG